MLKLQEETAWIRGAAAPTLTHVWLQAGPKFPHCYSVYFYPPFVSTVAPFFLLILRMRNSEICPQMRRYQAAAGLS